MGIIYKIKKNIFSWQNIILLILALGLFLLVRKNPFVHYAMLTTGLKTSGQIVNMTSTPIKTYITYNFRDNKGKLQEGDMKTLDPDHLLIDKSKKPMSAKIRYLADKPTESWIDWVDMPTGQDFWKDYWTEFTITVIVLFGLGKIAMYKKKEKRDEERVALKVIFVKKLRNKP